MNSFASVVRLSSVHGGIGLMRHI